MLLEDNPLKSKPQKKGRKKGTNEESEQQFIEMEEKFHPYSTLTSIFFFFFSFSFFPFLNFYF